MGKQLEAAQQEISLHKAQLISMQKGMSQLKDALTKAQRGAAEEEQMHALVLKTEDLNSQLVDTQQQLKQKQEALETYLQTKEKDDEKLQQLVLCQQEVIEAEKSRQMVQLELERALDMAEKERELKNS